MKTRIVLLGPPASGKGTQAEFIKRRYGIASASPGAMLRDEMRRGTPLGLEADRMTRDGSMVPDAMVIQLVGNWLSAHSTGFVFDGFPRTVAQADALDQMLSERQSALDAVLFFDITAETAFERVMNRLTCTQCARSFAVGLHLESAQARCPECGGELGHRSDDTPEALERRIAQYREKTEPLVEYYQRRGLLWTLRAADDPAEVSAQITALLETL
ncbi:MAG: nucleoside monophosphate kinase [Verrucomicrobiota bacterium]